MKFLTINKLVKMVRYINVVQMKQKKNYLTFSTRITANYGADFDTVFTEIPYISNAGATELKTEHKIW